jgi:hypothetical protein
MRDEDKKVQDNRHLEALLFTVQNIKEYTQLKYLKCMQHPSTHPRTHTDLYKYPYLSVQKYQAT